VINIPFIGQSYEASALDVSAQRCVNMQLEGYSDQNAKVSASLTTTPGLDLEATMSAGANKMRGMYQTSTERLFACRGNGVAEFDTSNTETSRFTINTGATEPTSTIVRMVDNGTQLMLVDGTDGWTYNLSTNVATQISDADFPAATHCGILDGFYLANKPNSTLILYSAVDDPTTWSSLSTMSKEGKEDFVNSFIVSNRRIWVFGKQSREIFRNTGNSNNQFLRLEGTAKNIGNQAPDSLAEDGNSVYWLGSNASGFGKVYKSAGFDAVPISTQPLETAISNYTATTDAEGYCYQEDGNSFYQLTFPTDNKTWAYNLQTGQWNEKEYQNTTLGKTERHRSRVHAFFNGKNYLGDHESGKIYSYNKNTYTDNGDTIIRKRISPVVWNALDRVYYKSFQLDIEAGQGLTSGQGSDPKVMYRHSNDAGRTWTNETQLSAGKIGEYRTRVKKNRLGQARNRVFEITYSEPTKFNIVDAHVELG